MACGIIFPGYVVKCSPFVRHLLNDCFFPVTILCVLRYLLPLTVGASSTFMMLTGDGKQVFYRGEAKGKFRILIIMV